MRDRHANLSCSFCGKGQREVRKLIAGPSVYICDECVRLTFDILAKGESPPSQCSFCHDNRQKLRKLVVAARGYTYICDECVVAAAKIAAGEYATDLERTLRLAQRPDANGVAIVARHFAKACDDAKDVPRTFAERVHALADEIDALVRRHD